MKVIQGFLILTIAIGFSLHAKDKGVSKNKPVHKQLGLNKPSSNLRILGPSVDYDIIRAQDDVLPARARNTSNRSVADTMEYIPADGAYDAYFYGYQQIGDAFLMAFQMPADATIKGVNAPVYHWGTGDQEITISLHKLSYPYGSDGQLYSMDYVDSQGWLGGYDMNNDGWMSIEGTTYTEGGMMGTCDSDDMVIPGAQDPLGTIDSVGPTGVPTKGLIWPDSQVATGNPDTHPADQDNWYATTNYGTEPEVSSGDWVGLLVQATGDGGGDDPTLGFYYDAADGVVPGSWVALKFYGECGGTSGNGGWHIRHWMWNFQLAVELTGDRGPIFGDMTDLQTTVSTADRSVSVAVTDDNPSEGSAGVESVILSYQLDSLTAAVNTVSLSLTSGTSESGTWTGSMPGQETGTFVYWSLTATDVNGYTTNTATNSYYIWQATAGSDLIFWNDHSWLYNILDYAQTIYFYWGEDHFDIWDAAYGNLNDEVVSSYDVIIELGMIANEHNADEVIDDWWNMTKTYIVAAGDEWLYMKYGIGDYITVPEGDVAREILGISSFHQDINSQHNPNNLDANQLPNRLMTVAANVVEPLQDFVDSVGIPLHYNPNYDPEHNNFLDGVSPVSGYHVAMTAYAGVTDDNGVPTDSTEYNVMIYSTNNGRSAFLSFDVIGLYTGSYHNDNQHWVGAHSYNGYNVSPLGLVYEWLAEETVSNVPEVTISSENIVHGDTGLVDVSINDNHVELSSIDMSFAGFQGKLEFIEIVADDSSLMGSQGWLIEANDTDSLLITASAGAQNISGAGKLFSLKFVVPDTLSSQYVQVNLVNFLGNTDMNGAFENNGGVQSVWGPTIGFTTSETVGNYPLTVTFTDTSSAGTFPITTWSWDFGDDSTASGHYVTHTYQLPGLYDVSLIITDEFGLTDTLVKSNLVEIDTVYGDVDWNAQVQSFDASLILKDLVDMIELDDMQVTVADVSTDNTLSTLDATLILQYVVGTIGALPYDAGSQYVASGNVSMDDRGTGPGIPINIPLNISNGSNIYGFEMKVEFDHTLLEFDTLMLSELMDNYLLIYNSDTDGELIVAASGSNPDGETGSFGTLTFNVSDNFSDETVVSITRLRWNEGPDMENPASMTVSYALAIDSELLPDKFALHQNYPNPFNPVTRINYDLPEQGKVSIIIYDMLGRRVRTLIQRMEEPGYRAALWNATNDHGKPVSAGIYIYQIQTGEFIQTRKMILLK